jgi:hypothetical protein
MPSVNETDWRLSEYENIDLDPLAVRVRLINLAHEHMEDALRCRPIAKHLGKHIIPGEDVYHLTLDDRRQRIEVRVKELDPGRASIGVRPSRIVPGITKFKLLKYLVIAVAIALTHLFLKLHRGEPWYHIGLIEARSVIVLILVIIFVLYYLRSTSRSSDATREALRQVQEAILHQYA